jgi:hypothetical protein
MNDLDLVTELTPQVPLPAPADLAGPRRRLTAAIAGERTDARTRDESGKGAHLPTSSCQRRTCCPRSRPRCSS